MCYPAVLSVLLCLAMAAPAWAQAIGHHQCAAQYCVGSVLQQGFLWDYLC